MKYFAKYLPVEGEIEEGDVFQSGTFISSPVDKGYLKEMKKRPNDFPNLTKVKLFLCSRDIQVGDTITHSKSGAQLKVNAHVIPSQSAYIDWFKVIGEILTDGIKEGQEFTEKEVEYLTIGEINT
jgi:hypothetical protein